MATHRRVRPIVGFARFKLRPAVGDSTSIPAKAFRSPRTIAGRNILLPRPVEPSGWVTRARQGRKARNVHGRSSPAGEAHIWRVRGARWVPVFSEDRSNGRALAAPSVQGAAAESTGRSSEGIRGDTPIPVPGSGIGKDRQTIRCPEEKPVRSTLRPSERSRGRRHRRGRGGPSSRPGAMWAPSRVAVPESRSPCWWIIHARVG
jgi:hypothetical protein